jgi:hypothetical protein
MRIVNAQVGQADLRRVVEGARRHLRSETDNAINDVIDPRQVLRGNAHNRDTAFF